MGACNAFHAVAGKFRIEQPFDRAPIEGLGERNHRGIEATWHGRAPRGRVYLQRFQAASTAVPRPRDPHRLHSLRAGC